MVSDVLSRADRVTAELKSYEVVNYLVNTFGPTLTAYIAQLRTRSVLKQWALSPKLENHIDPQTDGMRRLRAAHTVATAIEHYEDSDVMRSWMIASNPRLGGRSPVELIRDDDAGAVLSAASAFLEDTYYS